MALALQIPLLQKIYLNFFFFGTRLFATHIVSFVFYCTLVSLLLASESSARCSVHALTRRSRFLWCKKSRRSSSVQEEQALRLQFPRCTWHSLTEGKSGPLSKCLLYTHLTSDLQVPICILAPEVSIPFWALVYVPVLVTISTVIFTPWYVTRFCSMSCKHLKVPSHKVPESTTELM